MTGYLTFLELFPLVVAVHIELTVFIMPLLNFGVTTKQWYKWLTTSLPGQPVMCLLRAFLLQCLRINILFLVKHVPGLQDSIADSLSHF